MIKVTDVRALPGDSAFLICSPETAILYDTGFGFTGKRIAENIKAELGDRSLDYIFLTHSHYDHVLGTPHILKTYPDARVISGEYTSRIFQKPTARALMRELDLKFANACGVSEYEDLTDRLRVDITVSDGDIIKVGDLTVKAIALPGHTRCSFGFWLESEHTLLSCETLGVFDGEKNIIPSCLVGYKMTLDSIERAKALPVERLLVPHLGLVDSAKAEYYLSNSDIFCISTCEDIAKILKSGGSHDDALKYFKERFYYGEIVNAYPIDAMELNTSIMIGLIEKELLAE